MFVVVVLGIVPQSFEVVVLACFSRFAYPDEAQSIGTCQQGVFRELLHVGIDIQFPGQFSRNDSAPKSKNTR